MDFKHIVGTTEVQAFPGAYIYSEEFNAMNGSYAVPIYGSIANASNYFFLSDKEDFVSVLPGFKLEVYANPDYQAWSYTVDNFNGTDVKFSIARPANTFSSCKLYFKGVQI